MSGSDAVIGEEEKKEGRSVCQSNTTPLLNHTGRRRRRRRGEVGGRGREIG